MSLGATVRAATEQLEARGLLDGAALDRRRDELGEEEERERARLRLQVIYDDDPTDKYAAPAVMIDCASRVALCRAACCRLGFSLTPQDLREGIIAWEFGAPYRNAQRAGGYCRHLDDSSHTCAVYAHRPRVCRTHDCRADRRIWIDFDARIVNPDILLPQWPRRAEVEAPAPAVARPPADTPPAPVGADEQRRRRTISALLDALAARPIMFAGAGWLLATYGVLLGLAFGVASLVWTAALARRGLQPPSLGLLLAIVLCAFWGSKAVYRIERALAERWGQSRVLSEGNTLSGGLLGGSLVVLADLVLEPRGAPAWVVLDCAAPALAFGWAVGKLGCVAAGCCVGRRTDGPVAVRYHNRDSKAVWFYRLTGQRLLPVPFLESVAAAASGVLASLVLPAVAGSGGDLAIVLLGYAVVRGTLEPLRFRFSDERASRLVPALAHVVLATLGLGLAISAARSLGGGIGAGLAPTRMATSWSPLRPALAGALGVYLWGVHRRPANT